MTDDEIRTIMLKQGLRELFYSFARNSGNLDYVVEQVFTDFTKAGYSTNKLSRQDERRLVCEGLAEWWDGECPHNPSKLVARWECRRCSMLLMDALREGRVLGEEENETQG